jgi:nitrite reductase (NADH) large subunit
MYIIIGQGIAGATAANTLIKLAPHTPVTVITNEHDYLYSRIDLPDIIAGKHEPAASTLQKAEDFASAGITCIMGEKVSAVVPSQKTVELESGKRLRYDKLLLATGSLPLVPSLPGVASPGVYSLWTMQQAKEIIDAAGKARRAVVVGAGLIGLKTALALHARGLQVTVVEKLPRVLPRQLDDASSNMLADCVREKGVEVLVNTGVDGIAVSNGVVSGVNTAGNVIPADLVIMAIGVKPSMELAVAAGLNTGRGITVNEFQQTSQIDIYAAGDVAEIVDSLTGELTIPALWPVAVEQGRIAASNMIGQKELYDGTMAMNAVEIGGMPLISIGDIEGRPGDDVLVAQQGVVYRKVVVRNNKVRGVLCLGDIRQAGVIGRLIARRVEISEIERLISPHFNYADLIAV